MTGLDGHQVLAEMRHDPDLAEVPVIVLTATAADEDAGVAQAGQVTVHRANGLQVSETLRCIAALIDILQPDYDDHEILDSKPRTSYLRSLPSESVRFER
jgi:response regulator RpfG family c-di-GMP phosphodiesterase